MDPDDLEAMLGEDYIGSRKKLEMICEAFNEAVERIADDVAQRESASIRIGTASTPGISPSPCHPRPRTGSERGSTEWLSTGPPGRGSPVCPAQEVEGA